MGHRFFPWVADSFAQVAGLECGRIAGFPRVHRVLPGPTARQSSAQAAGLGNLANTTEPWKGGTYRAHSQMDRSSKATPFLDCAIGEPHATLERLPNARG
jgi:hypothetical protein